MSERRKIALILKEIKQIQIEPLYFFLQFSSFITMEILDSDERKFKTYLQSPSHIIKMPMLSW